MKQLDPIETPLGGIHLVEASAGTGKTYNIGLLAARLLAEAGIAIDQLLVVTFTEAATAEMRGVIRRRLQSVRRALKGEQRPSIDDGDRRLAERLKPVESEALARIEAALRDFDRAAVLTIHAFCRRALAEHAFESGAPLDAELDPDREPLLRELAFDIWAREADGADPDLAQGLVNLLGGPETLLELVKLAASQPDLEPRGGEPVAGGEGPDVSGAFCRAAEAWRSGRDEALARLLAAIEAGDITKNTYNADKVQRWAGEIDGMLAASRPPRGSFESLRKLSATSLVEKANKKAELEGRFVRHPCFDALEELAGAAEELELHLERRVQEVERRAFLGTRELLAERRAETRTLSFDDLLHELDRALEGPGRGERLTRELRDRYRAALIDEFQDTDRVQWRIFRRLFGDGKRTLFLIGDPKQAIYSFRGGDVFTYLAAAAEAGRRHTLGVNWRSDPIPIGAVNSLLAGLDNPFVDPRISAPPVAPRPGAENNLRIGEKQASGVEILVPDQSVKPPGSGSNAGPDSAILSELIADDLARLLSRAELGGRALEPSDVAVLVPKNDLSFEVQEALRRRGIPGVPWSDRSVLASREANDVFALLAALADPADGGIVRAALATDLLGLDAAAIDALLRDEESWEAWVERFRRWREQWDRDGFVRAVWAVLDHEVAPGVSVLARLVSLPDGERRATNVRHLVDLVHSASQRERLSATGAVRWLEARMAEKKSDNRESVQLHLDSDARAVRIITLHKSKGLEFPVVYLPFSWKKAPSATSEKYFVFHDPDRGDRPCLDLDRRRRKERQQRRKDEDFAENVRMLYVGLTRARQQCRLVWGGPCAKNSSALGWLLHGRFGGDSPAGVEKRLKDLAADELRQELERLSADSGGAVGVSELRDRGARRTASPRAGESALEARRLERKLPRSRFVSSFSAIASRGRETEADRDGAASVATSTAAPLAGETVPLAELPAGARTGICLHEILERADLAGGNRAELEKLSAGRLAAGGLDAARWAVPVAEALEAAARVPLDPDGDGPRLADIASSARAVELEFALPVEAPVATDLVAEAIGRGPDAPSSGYLEKLAALGEIPPGTLRGFIDLVFEWRGRYYLADYKSNHLGPRWSDYSPAELEAEMETHHYHLQSRLYALALDRLLRGRLPGTGIAQKLGGMIYLFLRGMHPERGAGAGVFCARPSAESIAALDRLFPPARIEGGES
ncbi:MAG: exodeoxyribonuclease V subunit beta [Polyangia bacterium]